MELNKLEEMGNTRDTTLVVGGGIAGLYCAYRLQSARQSVFIVEARSTSGGKIQTETLGPNKEYIAEFGPMRFEPGVQPELDKLRKELRLDWVDFDGPVAATPKWPDYNLQGRENTNAIKLLRMGITLALGEYREDERELEAWLERQGEEDYEKFRNRHHATVPGVLLRDMTLWNALAAPRVLSHLAIMKVRDLGSFYHMVHENVNAVEWIIWWLRALKPSAAKMTSFEKGSKSLTDAIESRLTNKPYTGTRAVSYRHDGRVVWVTMIKDNRRRELPFSRVVLALPPSGLAELASSLPSQIRQDLDTVEAYALLKVFFLVRNPWWKPDTPPQTRASSTPTREIHYQRRSETSPHGMVMVYTDRPANSYWQNYVLKAEHDEPEDGDTNGLRREFARYLAEEVVEARTRQLAGLKSSPGDLLLTEEAVNTFEGLEVEDIVNEIEQRVEGTRIRDWGRPPFSGAYHAWKPKVYSTRVMQRMSQFGPQGPSNDGRVHICGEAYSNYQGFIEGALRTANTVVNQITTSSIAKAPQPQD